VPQIALTPRIRTASMAAFLDKGMPKPELSDRVDMAEDRWY